MPPVELIEALETLAGGYGIGRGIHLGDTVLGTKGRVAFEAPAAITLITAHRELEKLVLSAQQSRVKDGVASVYGDLVHEGKQLDLVCADIEAFFSASQRRVTGTVSEWTAADALGYARILSLPGSLQTKAGGDAR
jgi:argininosuccinate synthase